MPAARKLEISVVVALPSRMLKQYFDDLTADLALESERIRAFFATHRLSAGVNREEMVAKLLKAHILPSVGVETGLILSSSEEFSNQADIILTDAQSSGPLYGARPIPIWLMESVYSVIEVKTQLTPTTLADCIAKCVRLKTLPTRFADALGRQKITDTLFCLWAFETSDDLKLAKDNIAASIRDIPQHQQPDFIVVPGRFLWRGGHYHDISVNGQPGSQWRQMREQQVGGDPSRLLSPNFEMMDLGNNTLVVFLIWLNSWLYAAGPRRPSLVDYIDLPSWGTIV